MTRDTILFETYKTSNLEKNGTKFTISQFTNFYMQFTPSQNKCMLVAT